MNEHQVENLLGQHGDEILRRQRVRQMKAQPKTHWKPIIATGIVVATAIGFVLIPRNAEAARVARVKSALHRVHSMEIRGLYREGATPWKEYIHFQAQDGRTRQESNRTPSLKLTIIADEHHSQMDYDKLPFVLRSKQEATDDTYLDPLKTAQSYMVGSSAPPDYTVQTRDGGVVDGKATYVLTYRPSHDPQSQEFTLIIDKATDLPLSASGFQESKGIRGELKYEYRYGQTWNPSVFSMETNKEIIDPEEGQKQLLARWSGKPTNSQGPPIYSATTTPDGSVWLAYGIKDWQKEELMPSKVIVAGTPYTLAFDFATTWQPTNKQFRIHGKEVMISVFTPVKDSTSPPDRVKIQLGFRSQFKPAVTGFIEPMIDVDLTKDSTPAPKYMASLNYSREFFQIGIHLFKAKALAREASGDLEGAIDGYLRQAEETKNFVAYAGYKPILEAVRCAHKLGQDQRAKDLEVRANTLKNSRAR